MEKKNFIIPEAIIIELFDDIVTGSGPGQILGGQPGDEGYDEDNN